MRNSSEWPSDAAVSFLSEVLEPCAPQKYYLSPKACAGILRRAETRGKNLPPLLQDALEQVIRCSSDADARGGKGALIQDDVSATLSTANAQTIFQPLGFAYNAGGKAASCAAAEEIAPTLRAASNGENGVCYCIQGDIARGSRQGQNGRGWSDDGTSYTLNTVDNHVVCVADDNAKAAVDEDVCGTLKVGGGSPLIAYQRPQEPCVPEILRELAPNMSKRAR